VALALAWSDLPLRYRLPALGHVPTAEALTWMIAYDERLCRDEACRQKPEGVKVESLACTPLSARRIDSWKQWDSVGGARCSFRYATGADAFSTWSRLTRTLAYRKHGCGDEGQEADLWCLTWNVREEG
jgi:hypothetical protein